MPTLAATLRAELAAGGRYPAWDDAALRPLIPAPARRAATLAELCPRPLAFFTEALPMVTGWPDAPCAYLRFSAAYDRHAAAVRARGWQTRAFNGGHFLPAGRPGGGHGRPDRAGMRDGHGESAGRGGTMRILIIGGTGYMGPFVARQLAAQGHELTLFHRGQSQAELPKGIAHIHGDRAEIERFADEFRRLTPDVTLDMRPLIERDAQTALAALRGATGRVVAISSMDVYRAYGRLIGTEPGEPDPIPLTEESPTRERHYPYRTDPPRAADDPTRWRDDYDKLPIERLILGDPALPGTILRLPIVHGPGDEQRRFFGVLRRMDDRRPAILLDRGLLRMLACREYVENVAAAIALAVTDERAAGRIYNVCDAEPLTEEDWIRLVARAAGWGGEIVALSSAQLPAHLRTSTDTRQDLFASSARLRQELGYVPPIDRAEGLRRTIAWERANPPATIDPALFDYAAEDAALAARA